MEVVSEVVPESWFARKASRVAPGLVGAYLCLKRQGHIERWKIVEVEALSSAAGLRAKPTSGSCDASLGGGVLEILRRGRFWTLSLCVGREGHSEKVLVRSLEPQLPCDVQKLRNAAGPSRVVHALGLGPDLSGLELNPESGIWVEFPHEKPPRSRIARTDRVLTPRVGRRAQRTSPVWYLKTSLSVSSAVS